MSRATGDKGEAIAVKFLKKSGYKILEKNYRALRGEIDIIAREKDVLVFVEVKTNNRTSDVLPEMRVGPAKQQQIGKVAQAYLSEKDIDDLDCRFDVIGIILNDNNSHKISHIPNAFWLPR